MISTSRTHALAGARALAAAFSGGPTMKPTFDKRILVMGLLVLAALAWRPAERLAYDTLPTGSINRPAQP